LYNFIHLDAQVIENGTKLLLSRLLNKRIIGGKHTPEERVLGWIAHLPPDEQKRIKNDWGICIKQRLWVFRMKKTGEWHVSLNPKRIHEISNAIKNGGST